MMKKNFKKTKKEYKRPEVYNMGKMIKITAGGGGSSTDGGPNQKPHTA